MKSQAVSFSLITIFALALSACSPTIKSDESSAQIELAVSEVCPDPADPQCVSIKDENVISPTEFKTAKVETIAVSESEETGQVDLTFTQDGASVFQSMTKQAAGAGASARMVLKIGGQIHSAIPVAEAIEGDKLQIRLSSSQDAQELADLIQSK